MICTLIERHIERYTGRHVAFCLGILLHYVHPFSSACSKSFLLFLLPSMQMHLTQLWWSRRLRKFYRERTFGFLCMTSEATQGVYMQWRWGGRREGGRERRVRCPHTCQKEGREAVGEGGVDDRPVRRKKLYTWLWHYDFGLSTPGCMRVGKSILRTWCCLRGYWYCMTLTSERWCTWNCLWTPTVTHDLQGEVLCFLPCSKVFHRHQHLISSSKQICRGKAWEILSPHETSSSLNGCCLSNALYSLKYLNRNGLEFFMTV